MKALFEGIVGQERVCGFLQEALETGRTTHAYLLVGASQEVRAQIAQRFAAALVAAGDEAALEQALHHSHPDLHLLQPQSATGYLIDQVRELVHDAELAPIRSKRKAYVVDQADRLTGASANAFLKTLEEPPADVTCILLAENERSVLETLRSRCQVLTCARAQETHNEDQRILELAFQAASGASNYRLLQGAKDFVAFSTEGLEDLTARQEEEAEASGDFLTQGAKKAMEARHKREVNAQERQALLANVAAVRTWLRDCLLTAEGTPELRVLPQCSGQTTQTGTSCSDASIVKALDAVNAAEQRLKHNVTPQLAIEAMFFEIREAVCPQ